VPTQEVLWIRLGHLCDILAGGVQMGQLFVRNVSLVVPSRPDAWIDRLRTIKAGVGLLELGLAVGSIAADLADLVLDDESTARHLVLV